MAITALLPSILLMIQKLKLSFQSFPSLTNLSISLCNDLDKLSQSAKSIQDVLNNADEKVEEDMNVKSLLKELEDAAYDAQDVIDELEIELVSLSRLEADDHLQLSTKVCSSITYLSHRIKDVNEIFEDMLGNIYALHLKENHKSKTLLPNIDVESLVDSILYGREDDMRNVIDLLLEEKPEIPCVVVPLVGAPGIGKTSLVQSIYDDSMICKHFDRKGWVFISQDYDLIMLIRAILESFTQSSWSWAEQSSLQTRLECEIEKKRFLIVLDDFCTENLNLLESFRSSFSRGRIGSRILLLTREESVVNAFQTMQSYRLDRLSEENCWKLFLHHAFPSHDHVMDQNLMFICKRITEKCKGMLLPIKMLGGAILYSETDRFMREDICEENIMWSAFKISYDCLLPQLKRCLSYCSLFPKSQLFDKDQLVRLWMAQGYIDPVEGKRLDEIGCEYFYELLRRSFFHISNVNKQAYVMHHLIFELLHSFSEIKISKVENDRVCNISEKARSQSYVTEKDGAVVELKCSAESTPLHSFLLVTKSQSSSLRRYSHEKDLIDLSFPSDLFIKMKRLRALDLSYTAIKELPDSIGTLIHLRFLALNHTKIKKLPQSSCNLYYLQTLELQDCSNLLELPVGISCLSSLQHLGISKPYSFVLLPRDIGKLTTLITLSNFYIGRDSSSYYVIRELESLVNLRGELCISGLSNVISVDDAKAANMKNKEFIEKLILEWRCNDVNSESYIIRHMLNDHTGEEKRLPEQNNDLVVQNEEIEWITQIDIEYKQIKRSREERLLLRRKILELREGVLENLQPHRNLKELFMENYEGSKLARWMGDSTLSKLVSISLSNCYKCEVLPPIGQLPFLKHLLLKGFNKLKYVGAEFCGEESNGRKPFGSLEKLEFEGMYAWEEWREVNGAFPRLLELSLSYCQRLKTMPPVFSSLEKLKLRDCSELTSFPAATFLSSLDVLRRFPIAVDRLQFVL